MPFAATVGASKGLRALGLFWIVLCAASLGIALVAQHAMGMQPCPWCVVQRLLMLASMGCMLLVLGSLRVPIALALPLLANFVFQVAGIAAAGYQFLVASRSDRCDLGLADRILIASGLEQAWPWMFAASTSCTEAASATLLGFPFSLLALGFFILGLGLALAMAWFAWRSVFGPDPALHTISSADTRQGLR